MALYIILGVVALGFIFYYKNKADDSRIDAILGKTREEDRWLRKEQAEIDAEIEKLNQGIEEMRKAKERADAKRDKQSDEERADGWNKKS